LHARSLHDSLIRVERTFGWTWMIALAAALLSPVVLGACHAEGSFEEYCERLCRCEDACSDAQLAQCQDFGRDWEARAAELGCDDELSRYFGCYNAHLVCRDGGAELDDGGQACVDEDAALPVACNPFAAPD
jgi:hypothetical protein